VARKSLPDRSIALSKIYYSIVCNFYRVQFYTNFHRVYLSFKSAFAQHYRNTIGFLAQSSSQSSGTAMRFSS